MTAVESRSSLPPSSSKNLGCAEPLDIWGGPWDCLAGAQGEQPRVVVDVLGGRDGRHGAARRLASFLPPDARTQASAAGGAGVGGWIGIPALVIATYYAFLSPIPFDVRLAASRAGMENAAAQITANPGAAPAWIGLYPVERIDRYENGSGPDLGLRLPGPCWLCLHERRRAAAHRRGPIRVHRRRLVALDRELVGLRS